MRISDHRSKTFGLLLAGLCFLTYAPVIDNGFVTDDYVILERIEILKTDPLHLFTVPPENFRVTSYMVFGILKTLVGYSAGFFYVFNIFIHFLNAALLWHLVLLLTQRRNVAAIAAYFFAVFKAPHQAVMWPAAMNETLLFLFVLATLLSWLKGRRWMACLLLLCALFSKESALVVLVLVPLLQLKMNQRLSKDSFWLLVPAAVFAAVFVYTWPKNFMVAENAYRFGAHAGLVILKSLARLLWPWVYVLLALVWLSRRRWMRVRDVAYSLALIVLVMLPYMFIAYQSSLPSRQLYMASAAYVFVLALLLMEIEPHWWQGTFAIVFVAFNIGHVWLSKDPDFEAHAAPTTQLVAELRRNEPRPMLILGFPSYASVARATTFAVPGWRPDLVLVGESAETCPNCRILNWDAQAARYQQVR
jgi:hypothetical protein